MNMAKGALLFFLVICTSFLLSLDPHRRITQYAHQLHTTADGLPQNSVISILQTSDGYLWIGTLEGLTRFDGVTFTSFKKDTHPEIKSEYIYTLFEGHQKNLWIGTREGLLVYQQGNFKNFTTNDGLWDNIVRSIFMDSKGVLWIGTARGLNRKTGGIDSEIEKIPRFSSIQVKSIYEDRSQNMWFCTGQGLAQLKDDKFHFFTIHDGLSSNLVQNILEDHSGNLWIATYGGGLNRFSKGTFTTISTAHGLVSNNLTGLCLDKDNNLWVGSEGSGVNRITLPEGTITTLNSKNGLSNNYMDPIYEDKEGSLWIGTEKGINQLHNGKLITWTTAEGLTDDYISGVYEDSQKRLWIGTYTGGLNILTSSAKTGTFQVSTVARLKGAETLPLQINSLWEDSSHHIWIGTRGSGLVRSKLTGSQLITTTFTTKNGLSHNAVWAIYEDHNQDIWIGTRKGLNKFVKGTFKIFGTNEGLNNENIYAITSDHKGNLWIGTAGGGLHQFKNGKFTAYTTENGLSENNILCIYQDPHQEDVLWIGTSYGLNRFENGTFFSYTTRNGLFDNVVFQILEDSEGFLWMSSNKGISKVKKEELHQLAAAKIKRIHTTNYGLDEGMRDVECNGGFQPAGWKSSSGKLLFPSVKGLVMISPGKEEFNPTPPPVYIERIVVNGRPIEIMPGSTLEKNITIGPGVDKLEFHYTALSFLSPQKVKFQLKLEGYDKEWESVEKPRDRIAYYGRLSPGGYTFRVKACNNDGVWNETGSALAVKVLPFFWETWWFRLAALLIFAAVSYFIINLSKKYAHIFQFWKQKNYIGNYRLIDKIGSGGMGTVYLAYHTAEPSKKVALKVLKEEFSADKVQVKRFKQEALIIDQIEHPNIVKIIERGEHREHIYIAMELLSGETLGCKLAKEKRLTIPDSLHIMKQITGAFALIHRKNIIHRDLKPENIMLIQKEKDPLFVKLLDFGLARAQAFSRLTESGIVVGTISYISPEQVSGNVYSTASDIYSLGVTFYEMLTGKRPFSGETTIDIMLQIINKSPLEPLRLCKEVPEELSHLIMRMMAKKPENRPNIREVCSLLEQISPGK